MAFSLQNSPTTKGDTPFTIVEMQRLGASASTMSTALFEEGQSIFNWSPFMPNVVGRSRTTRPTAGREGGSAGHASGASSEPKTPNTSSKEQLSNLHAPEKDLTLFAMRLAVLEKVASTVGTLGFVWATVVLLGGYAITLKESDFWFVTIILVIEGCRIFSRSHELEWQHQDAGIKPGNSFSRAYHRGSDAFIRSKRMLQTALSHLISADKDDNQTHQSPLVCVDQHQDQPSAAFTYEGMDAKSSSFHANGSAIHTAAKVALSRTWSSSKVPLIPFFNPIFHASHVSRFLYWMQLVAAVTAIVLSVCRLQRQDFTRPNETDTRANHRSALFVFYSLATFEALIFLLERSYWETQISCKKILVHVNEQCGLASEDLGTMRRFFYDVYSKCLTESIFEGLKMDMVDYALAWLQSDVTGEQLGGLRVLLRFSSNSLMAEDTLRTVSNRQGMVERLLDMITWKNVEEQEIRKTAAYMLRMLVKHNRNSVRVVAISGSIEGIFSLLAQDDEDAYYIKKGGSQPMARKSAEMIITGLRIFKNLAKDPLNGVKIGMTKGLLPRLISFIDARPETLSSTGGPTADHHLLLVKKSLDLLNLLAAATGKSGKMLREEIAKVVFTIPNLRKILEHAHCDVLIALAVDMLSSLSMDDEVREIIGRTGGIIRNLLTIFVRERAVSDEQQAKLARKAGEVLSLLVLKNEENCWRMMRFKVDENGAAIAAEEVDTATEEKDAVAKIVDLIENWDVGDLAMVLLRSICTYTDHGTHKVRIATSTVHRVLNLAMKRTGRAQEAALGLLAMAVGELTATDIDELLAQQRLSPYIVTQHLMELLKHHRSPSTSLPRIRLHCVELAMALLDCHPQAFLEQLKAHNFREMLHHLADSTSELENFVTFSGANGVTPHPVPMCIFIEKAIEKLKVHHLVFH